MNKGRSKKLLLVEDEAITSMVTANMLKFNGYDVVTVLNGVKAVDAVYRDKTIDLILMDIDLGSGINGPEAARQILQLRDIPIVFLTSHSEREMVEKVKEITRYGYVIKNSGDFVLLSSIEMAFELFETSENLKATANFLRISENRVRTKLESIISPIGDIGNLDLTDIIDIPMFQSLINDFTSLLGIDVAILDLKGNILISSGWQDICTKFHRKNPESCQNCLESDTVLTTGIDPGASRLYKCKNNMWDMVTPIHIGGKHMGNLFLGQFFFTDEIPDYELFRAQARQYGFDEDAYIAALERVPRFEREKVSAAMNLYIKFSTMISRLSHSNIQLARTLSERDLFYALHKENEAQLREITDNMVDLVARLDTKNYFQYVSPSYERILGYRPSELLGTVIMDLFHPVSREKNIRDINALGSGNAAYMEFRLKHKNGGYRWFEVSGRRLYDENGAVAGLVMGGREVTERKSAEKKLTKKDKQYRELFKSMTDGLALHEIIVDEWGTPVDYIFLEVNPAYEHLTGLNSWEIIGEKGSGVIPDFEPNWVETYGQVALTGMQITFENYSERMNKWYKVTAYSPERGFFVTIFEDISDRKKSETLLIEREERYKRLLESITGYVYTVFIENETVVNTIHGPGCEAITGYSPGEFSTDTNLWFKVIHPVDREQVVHFVSEAVKGNFYTSMEHRIIRKDGTTIWVRNIPVPHYNEDKVLIEYDGIITDITERKMAELSLTESEELFSKAFYYGPLVMVISDFETGKIIEVNDNFCKVSGYSRDEVIGKTSLEVGWFTEEGRSDLANNILNSGFVKDKEIILNRKNGESGTFRYFGEIISVRGNKQIFSIVEDITYRKKVEYKLRENEELLWNIINSSPDYIYFKDTGLRIVLCNEKYAEAMNKKPSELFGKTDIENGWDPELVKGDSSKGVTGFEKDDLLALEGNTVVSENEPGRLSGTIRYFNTIRIPLYKKGEILGLLGISRDITEKKIADQERDATINLLKIINSSDNLQDLMKTIIIYLKNWSGCEAVGIRLREGEDYPFYESTGFSEEFLMTENSPCTYNLKGQLKHDDSGSYSLECMCGNIICGRIDPGKDFFTPGGSFWTNSTSELLDSITDQSTQNEIINRCNGMGYESVALIPLRTGDRIFGLIQLHDRGKGRFTIELVELFERLAENVALSLSEKILKNVLSESESRFRNLFEHIPVAYQSFDSQGLMLDVNDNWLQMLGYNREEVIGRCFGDFWAEKSGEAFNENLKSFFRNKIIDISELSLLKKNGDVITVILSGRVQSGSNGEIEKTHCVIIDISERKIAEDILREREEFISGVLNALSAHIAVLDDKGYIVAVNEAWRKFLKENGITEENSYLGENYLSVSKKAFKIFGDELAGQVYDGILSVMQGNDEMFSIEYPCHAPVDMKWFKAFVTRFSTSEPYHFVIAHENITERKKAEAEIQSLLREKEILLREVHHRIKNNMNTIAGLLMLQAGSISDQAAISALNDARSRVQSMMIMYDKLYRSDDYRKMSVKDYLEKFIDEIFVIFENSRNVHIEKDIEDFILDTKILFPLGIIINELITNAFKYAYPDGRRGTLRVMVKKDDDMVSLIIQDDGVGFTDDTASPKPGGFGLNLVTALTDQISGQFRISGENGTRVEISFNQKW